MQTNFCLIDQGKIDYRQSLLRSLGLHFVIMILIWIAGKSFNFFGVGEKVSFMVVEKSIRVDVVAMPTQTLAELKNIDISTTVIAEEKKSIPVQAPPEESDYLKIKKNFLSTLKDLGKRSVGAKKREESANPSKLQGLILAGNRLSQGSSIQGKDSGSSDTSTYLTSLPEQIKPHWRLPSYLKDRDLQCRVRIFLTSTGELIKSEVYESSGIPEYDDKALKAVRGASPFGPVPKEIAERALRGEILLGFPL